MARVVDKSPETCKKCCQYSKGTCLVLSINVRKYGKPKECMKK